MTPRAPQRAPIRFGTDGWRGEMAGDFTFANVERVAQAYADYLSAGQRRQQQQPPPRQQRPSQASGHNATQADAPHATRTNRPDADNPPAETAGAAATTPHVIVGHDRRFLSEQFARVAAQVFSGNGARVSQFESDVPTPLVSWAVRERGASGGVCITASHNPATFNGFKIKAPFGGSATPEMTSAVEALVDATPPRRSETPPGEDLNSSVRSYRAQVASYVDIEWLRGTRGRVVVDSMHGTGGRWVESLLAGGRLRVETIRGERDAFFGGVAPEPIDRNLAPLKRRVAEAGALVGLATDGDADRVGAVNEAGETMNMHEVVPVILLHLARARGMRGGVVRTFSQSVLLKRIAEAEGLRLHETPIGFKYIADLMLREDILLGAEESGGIGVSGHLPERDGILNSLLLLEAVVASGKTPTALVRELHREFGEFYYDRRDLRTDVARGLSLVGRLGSSPPRALAGFGVSGVERTDGTKLLFADESWLLFRQSGTEPVLRIYSEATSREKVRSLLEAGSALAQAIP